MTSSSRFDIWVGSELGLLKGVTLCKDVFTNYGDIKMVDKSKSILTMCKQKENILVGLRSGTIRTFNTSSREYKESSLSCVASAPVRGLVALKNGNVLSCTENGVVQHWKDSECLTEKSVGDDIRAMSGSVNPDIFATGGQENDIKIWKLDNMDKPIFAAKNVRNDFLNLRVPIWVSALEFLRNDTNKVVVGSGHHSIRLYDRRDKRRPVIDTDWHEHPITALAVKKGNASVIVGNSAGYMADIDLRTGKQVGGFKGNSGSIRSIVCHPSQPIVVSAGLDRFLKVYDLTSRKILKKIYLKSNLNSIVLRDGDLQLIEPPHAEKREYCDSGIEENGAGSDEIWEKMEAVSDKKKRKLSKKKKT